MGRSSARSDILTLAFFWLPVFVIWILTGFRLGANRDMTFWIVSAVLLLLYLACVAWLALRWQGLWKLRRLPWYLVIGPTGAGKTTLLKNSGFPWEYPAPAAPKLLDSFFTGQSIVLNELGGYVVYSHDDPPHAIRQELVKQLTAFLRDRSPRATVLALPLDEVDPAVAEQRARSLRVVLSEIADDLGTTLPVYLVFTHCDRLRGFDAFSAHLSSDERDDAWGTSLTSEQQRNVRASFAAESHSLAEAVQARLLHIMTPENAGRNWDALHFPQKFRQACEAQEDFVATLFAHSPLREDFVLRGMYFACGTTDDGDETRSYFVRGLLTKMIGGDTLIARPTDQAVQRVWALRIALTLGASIAAAGLLVQFGGDFLRPL